MVSKTGLCALVLALSEVGAGGAKATSPPVFTIETPPSLRTENGFLAGAAALSPTDAWAVGTIIAHWNGKSWQRVALPPKNAKLADVSALAGNDVWVAGTGVASDGISPVTVAEHWNGSSWSVVPTPALTGDSPNFSSIVAISSSDVWAAGNYIVNNNLLPLFEHWDGHSWTVVPGNVTGANFVKKLAAVSASDIWAVGMTFVQDAQGTILPFVEHWNGTKWQPVTAPHVGAGGEFYGVTAVSSTDVWAVGDSIMPKIGTTEITANPIQTLAEHWDGKAWKVVPSPNIGPTSVFQANHLTSVAALSGGDVWAAGRFTLPDGQNRQLALAMHWNGTTWTIQPTPDIGTLTSLSGAATAKPSSVWFVGSGDFPGLISGGGPLMLGATGG